MGTGSIVCLQLSFCGVREPGLVLRGRGQRGLCKMFVVLSRSSGLTGTSGSSSGLPGTLGCTRCRELVLGCREGWTGDSRAADVALGLVATSGVAGRQLEHGEAAVCAPGGHCTPSQLEEKASHPTQLLSSCREQQVSG